MQKGQALIVLLVGILILAVAGGAIYLSRQTTPKSSPVPATVSQTLTPSPLVSDASPVPTDAGETANWKTFSNSKFTFKYPSNWEDLTSGQASDYPDKAEALLRGPIVLPSSTEPLRYSLTVNVKTIDSSKSLNQIIDEYYEKKDSLKKTNTKIDSQEAIYVEGFPSRSGALEVFTKNKNILFTFLLDPYDLSEPKWKSKEYGEIFNKILSTFKFL